jgi:EAL domain-containing protein (putative c-di-GMP-specific phosphodiesterase class I)/ActR/RegA family two-component response regulator
MGETPRILIVDDDDEIRSILCDFLSTQYSCKTLDCAQHALTLLARERFDLVISDIGMPGMTGLEMIPRIMYIAPDTSIVIISGQRMIESAIAAMRAGALDYITKPFELRQVDDVVRRALAHAGRKRHLWSSDHSREEKTKALKDALANEAFVIHYQPQVRINSRKVVGAEALLRWRHPQHGLISPNDFIPWAEQTGQIVPLGEFVLRKACTQARRCQRPGQSSFSIAINVSPCQLREEDFPETVKSALEATQLRPQSLELELTETSLMQNPDAGIQTLERLRKLGVRIAIDDFGTGYSSLGYLKRLPIDSVKLDASFIKDATTDPDDAALVMAIITLAHSLRLKVIAEGIEREDQLAFLRLLRCDEGQGYLFGKPVSAQALAASVASAHAGVMTFAG